MSISSKRGTILKIIICFTIDRLRESSRDELFEKAKGEILDEVVNLSQISAKDWERLLYNKLWDKLSSYCFENIYLAAANANSPGKILNMQLH